MENYQLIIKAYDRSGALERILRVIRHRGGYIQSMNNYLNWLILSQLIKFGQNQKFNNTISYKLEEF